MLKEERFDFILKELKSSGKVSFEGVALRLNISEDTVRRDIQALHKSGLVTKVRGGAIRPNLNPLAFQDRADLFTDGKKIIALKALHFLENVRTVFMDGGTTVMALAAALPVDTQLRIVTNNMALPDILDAHKWVDIILLGGKFDRNSNTTFGTKTCAEIRDYHADVYFMGMCAIDSTVGITASVLEEGEIKKAFMASSVKTIVLGNQEKLETVDFCRVADFKEVDTLITDLPSNDALLDNYRKLDIEIV